jgi:flagellin-like hook-associated protein FlgL
MMKEDTRELYVQAISQWDSASQFRQLQEECAELIAKIN